jgi:uncharacterized protein
VSTLGVILVALVIAIGLAGIVIPILPGGLLVLAAITAEVIKYTWPVRRMRAAEVGTWSLVAGAVLGVIGFFVVPVLGLVLGFILGVYLAELAKHQRSGPAWRSTVHALKGVALSVGVEFTGALLAAITWAVAVLVW